LARDIIIARAFGVSGLTDALVAFRIPNLLRRLFAEGAFAQAFIPIMGEVKENNSDVAVIRQTIDRVASALFLALTLITLIGIIGCGPWWSWLSRVAWVPATGRLSLTPRFG